MGKRHSLRPVCAQPGRHPLKPTLKGYFYTNLGGTLGKRFLLRFKEKGGKEKELPVHHKLEELLDQYLKASGLEKEPASPLFPASIGKTGSCRAGLSSVRAPRTCLKGG